MQEKKNKKLVVILLVLILATLTIYFTGGSNGGGLDVDRALFSYEEPSEIDRVTFMTKADSVQLSFNGSDWVVDNTYEADPQRIKVLFAIIKQVRVRRPVAKQLADSISKKIKDKGTETTFFQGDQPVHKIKVWGDESSGITYMTSEKEAQTYIVEIPGYKSYLAGIFTVDTNGWRDPLVFDINWRNMQRVRMIYPNQTEKSFDITFDNNSYQISQLSETDTTKLFNVLDDISLLFLNDYIAGNELQQYVKSLTDTTAAIIVEDVGKNAFTLEVYGEVEGKNAFLVRVDSSDFGLLAREKLHPVLRPKRYFKK